MCMTTVKLTLNTLLTNYENVYDHLFTFMKAKKTIEQQTSRVHLGSK